MNSEVDVYLRKATRGLWGRKKRDVREELATHIEGRVNAHRIGGLDEDTAVQRTLAELGRPGQVSSGMMRLHAGPSLAGLGALLVLVCALTVTLVSRGLAQSLNVTEQLPTRACIGTVQDRVGEAVGEICKSYEGVLWTTVEALKEVLEPQGAEVKSITGILVLKFPEGNRTAFVSQRYHPEYELGAEHSYDFEILPGYLQVWDVLDSIAKDSGLPLEFENWDNLKLRLGSVAFQLGTPDKVIQGRSFYLPYLVKVMNELIPLPVRSDFLISISSLESNPGINVHPQQVRINGKQGDIYGVVTFTNRLQANSPFNTGFFIDVAPAAQDGSVTFQLLPTGTFRGNEMPIRYVERFSDQPKEGETVVVRLPGKADRNGYGYEVVRPEQMGLEPARR